MFQYFSKSTQHIETYTFNFHLYTTTFKLIMFLRFNKKYFFSKTVQILIKLSNLNLNSIVFQKSNLIVCYFHFFNRQQILLYFFEFFCYRRRYFFYNIVIMFFDIIDVFSHNIIIRNFVIEIFFSIFFYSKLYFNLSKKKYENN